MKQKKFVIKKETMKTFAIIVLTFFIAITFHMILQNVISCGAVISQIIALSIASALLMGGLLGNRENYTIKYGENAYREAINHFGIWGMPIMASTVFHPILVTGKRILPVSISFFLGILIFIIGFLIHMSSTKTLGIEKMIFKKSYSQKERELVCDGIYSIIRHPIYLSGMHFAIGFGVIKGNWNSLACSLLVIISFYLWTIIEERELTESFGNEYMRYRDNTSRFIPKLNVIIRHHKKYLSFRGKI